VYTTPPADQPGLRISTDLGWTFVHRDRIWTLFGDSWLLDLPTQTEAPDDAIGSMSLSEFPDADSVERFIASHPAPAGQPAWRAAAPPLHYLQQPNRRWSFAPMTFERDGMLLNTGTGFTAMTGFSNGRDDERSGAFAITWRYAPIACDAGSCPAGYECDPGLGRDSARQWSPVCAIGESRSCEPGPGFCLDKRTSLYNETPIGRTESILMGFEVGLMNEADPTRFRAQPWLTRRFYNLTSRTVSDFDPARVDGANNDYRPARGNTLERSGVFVWGRSHFGGIGAEGRDAQLYLAWQPMPEPNAAGGFDWRPRFFAGVDAEGRPRFVERELDAQPLDLDAAMDGDQPAEPQDVVSQMAISWLPSIQRFVMFYGGDLAPEFLHGVFSTDADKVVRNPRGSLYVRFAKQPWGPWTTPRELLAAGDMNENAAAQGLYASGGILAHNRCTDAGCARYEPAFHLVPGNQNGVLYGPNIVDTWTAERTDGLDLYWFISTWNPYQVVLMKTTLGSTE
jgi:hypothetical protein